MPMGQAITWKIAEPLTTRSDWTIMTGSCMLIKCPITAIHCIHKTLALEDCRIQTVSAADESSATAGDFIPMVMVNGTLYLDTGHESTIEARCGMMDGKITSAVEQNKQPTENDQSNFGTGYGYQYGPVKGTIEIYMNEKWWVFATEEARKIIQSPTSNTEP